MCFITDDEIELPLKFLLGTSYDGNGLVGGKNDGQSIRMEFLCQAQLTNDFIHIGRGRECQIRDAVSIMLIIGFTTIFTWVLTMQKVPQTVGAFFMSLNMPAWAIALIFDVLILMIGTFIDVSPAILLLTPILLPVMVQYGFSPLQFGAMMITGLAIGLVTPPVGMCLNACNKINRMPIIEIFKGAAPYVICNVIVLISISLWGPLTTALPQLLGYSIF